MLVLGFIGFDTIATASAFGNIDPQSFRDANHSQYINESFSKTIDEIKIDILDYSIFIETHDSNEIIVEATIKNSSYKNPLTVDVFGDTLEINLIDKNRNSSMWDTFGYGTIVIKVPTDSKYDYSIDVYDSPVKMYAMGDDVLVDGYDSKIELFAPIETLNVETYGGNIKVTADSLSRNFYFDSYDGDIYILLLDTVGYTMDFDSYDGSLIDRYSDTILTKKASYGNGSFDIIIDSYDGSVKLANWQDTRNNTNSFLYNDEQVTVTSDETIFSTLRIGERGPGGGLIFYIDGNTYLECSELLGKVNWNDALRLAKNYDGGDYDDWYVPTKEELTYIYDNLHIKGFLSADEWFWSSSENSGTSNRAWIQNFDDGGVFNYNYSTPVKSEIYAVRAVRAVKSGTSENRSAVRMQFQTYDYSLQQVENLDIDISAAEIEIRNGEKFTVRIENTDESFVADESLIYSELESDGTLKIAHEQYSGSRDFWEKAKIFITIPRGSHFESIRIELNGVRLDGRNLDISASEIDFDINAGSITLSDIKSAKTDIDNNAGNISLSGTFTGRTNIDNNVGFIDLYTTGTSEQWSYAGGSNFLGGVRINNKKLSNMINQYFGSKKSNHFDIDCTMGSVTVSIY